VNTFDAITQRRAVKHYDPQHRFSDQEITRLMEAAILSPTSFNMQNWRFVLVTDPQLRQQIRAAAYDQAQVADASLLIVMTADLQAFKKDPHRYWRNGPKEVAEMLVGWMGPFYEDDDRLQRDEAMRSSGIAAQTIMLAAKAMGYDSCPMIGFEAQRIAELINLPDDHVIGLMITVGKAVRPAWPRPGQLPLEEVVVRNRF
jgi:nitroreductase